MNWKMRQSMITSFDVALQTVRKIKDLRDSVPAIIAIDVPKNGDYHFSCMQTSADSNN